MKTYKVEGMHCASCAGVKAKCSYAKGTLDVEGEHDSKKIVEVVNKSGYSIK
ncbi:MAG: hypothetical protein US68_C0038G0002 [Candidatus Shapirobacteria bacterium GW2011_GWE1_38_10]|uniref:HMA domain-containing protein n=1 Tax=Candidatus Shapirobacteria bacterium GW2011_GWE1_38_10 TaxID=1618488 RepID=A0A0G0L6L1_9BACT|nr:MAG: hypothetical protein US68_C0038G0002 [Candidatus Shapirobacteria bacterium GW2011_GWE1_38_10]